jgi:predicted TIM-barrel fold metal-dependent hydrolase
MSNANDLPLIISVDDHVMEPPDLWTSRLPSRYADRAPRVERARAEVEWRDGHFHYRRSDDGEWCDWWVYDDYSFAIPRVMHGAGIEDVDNTPTTYDAMDPGVWIQADRLKNMTSDHVEASLCFPNTLPRFAGQAFSEREDKDLALLCIQAYNDWLIDDWCGGEGKGRLLPAAILPLWDVELAQKEVARCVSKGCYAVAFSENPYPLGFPSIHTGTWDPLFREIADSEVTLCLHIGSSSRMPSTSPDAPFIVSSTLVFTNTMGSLMDFIFSGTLERVPTLKLAFSEGQIGWMPYLFERADKLWGERGENSFGSYLTQPPSSFVPGRIYGCMFDDETGLRNRDQIGMDQICFETDYPHADSTFPHTKETLTAMIAKSGLSAEETYKLLRGNAITAFGLQRFGINE